MVRSPQPARSFSPSGLKATLSAVSGEIGEHADLKAGGGIDEEDAAPLRRRAAGGGDEVALRMPRERSDAFGQAADAADEFAGLRVPQRDLEIAARRELRAVGAEGQRGDRRGPRVMLGRGPQPQFADEFDERPRAIAAVIGRAFVDPALDQRDFLGRQRVGFLRHAILGIRFEQQPVELGFLGLAGDDDSEGRCRRLRAAARTYRAGSRPSRSPRCGNWRSGAGAGARSPRGS